MNRGSVVLVDWPFSDLTGTKLRPADVVQADYLNGVIDDTIFVKVQGRPVAIPGTEVEIDDEPTVPLDDPVVDDGPENQGIRGAEHRVENDQDQENTEQMTIRPRERDDAPRDTGRQFVVGDRLVAAEGPHESAARAPTRATARSAAWMSMRIPPPSS